ncbi:ATP-binding protein [uncultured Bilophila sp.]|uniref:ATP-binding protein n=1 Tax=uncultured Bilophila sp. TaxID=529385 RepID=UPI00280A994E|nr:ATP-binding protein [uncultured Bilophila sp.]
MIDPLAMPIFKPLWEAFPYLPDCFAAWRGMTLGEIAASAYAAADGGRRPSSVAVSCMAKHAARSIGEEAGAAIGRYFSRNNAVLSANLHGIDCLPEMAQAVAFFGLDRMAYGPPGTVIPVLSCGGVSLQSSAYPRGLQSFHAGAPARFPLFRSAWQDTVELNAPALAEGDVRSIAAHWKLTRAYEERGIAAVLRHLLAPGALALGRFGEQASRVNAGLFAALFPDARPVAAYLELEEIARELLIGDLARPDSVLGRALFTPRLREGILRRLAGVRGCWSPYAASGGELPRTAGNGTAFFWGVDGRGRRHPLRLSPGKDALECPGFRLPLAPEAVIGALRDRSVYPGLFVSYMTLVLEHGLRCHGGIFLVRYLPVMLRAVRDQFMECGEPLPPLPGRTALAAFAISMQARGPEGLFPAGMLELLASGGIRRADLQRLAGLPLEAVLPLSLARWCLDYIPREQRAPAWEAALRKVAWDGLIIELS